MFLVIEKRFWKIVPVAVKNAFAFGNIVVCPGKRAAVFIVGFVAANRFEKPGFFQTADIDPD